jgi:DNA (cytosine-5)-methyltransferase 1
MLSAEVLFEPGTTTVASRQGLGKKEISPTTIGKSDKDTNIYAIQHATIGRKHTAGPQAKGYRNDGEAYTLDSRGGADAVCQTDDPFRIREASDVSIGLDGNRYRAVGNAVAVSVVEWIGRRILSAEQLAHAPKTRKIRG